MLTSSNPGVLYLLIDWIYPLFMLFSLLYLMFRQTLLPIQSYSRCLMLLFHLDFLSSLRCHCISHRSVAYSYTYQVPLTARRNIIPLLLMIYSHLLPLCFLLFTQSLSILFLLM